MKKKKLIMIYIYKIKKDKKKSNFLLQFVINTDRFKQHLVKLE